MAITETARLLASLELQDKFSPVIKTVEGKIDGVSRKLDGIGTATQRGVDRARTNFGKLRDSLKDSNTQIGLVGGGLAAIENFVPPDLRPFVRGLEDINNAAPKGIPGLIQSGFKLGIEKLKPVLDPLTGAVNGLKSALTSPGGIGVQGRMLLVGESIGLILAVNEVATSIRNGLADQAAALERQTVDFAKDASVQDLLTAQKATNSALEQLKHDPIGTMWIGGPALTHLQAMQQEIHDALQIRTGDVRPPDRLEQSGSRVGGAVGGASGSFFAGTVPGLEPGGDFANISFLHTLSGIESTLSSGTMKWRPADVIQIEDRRNEAANARILERLEANRLATLQSRAPAPIINLQTKVVVLGQTVTTQYSRYSTSVTGTGGNQI